MTKLALTVNCSHDNKKFSWKDELCCDRCYIRALAGTFYPRKTEEVQMASSTSTSTSTKPAAAKPKLKVATKPAATAQPTNTTTNGSTETKAKKPKGIVGKTLGLRIGATWAHLFHQNEVLKKTGNAKPLTDEELSKFMFAEFPERDSKSAFSVKAVPHWRLHYNNGGFHKGKKPSPKSSRYIPDTAE